MFIRVRHAAPIEPATCTASPTFSTASLATTAAAAPKSNPRPTLPPGTSGSKTPHISSLRASHASSKPSPCRLAHAIAGGRHPNSVMTPNAPAVSRAERKMSGLLTAKIVGGISVAAYGLASPSSLHPNPSDRKSTKPNTNPRNDVLTAKTLNDLTRPAAAGDVPCSVDSGSRLIPAARSSALTPPSTAPSHSVNMANGIAVPTKSAARDLFRSPSSCVATTGMTLWYTNARAMTATVPGTSDQSLNDVRFATSTPRDAISSRGTNVPMTAATKALLTFSSVLSGAAYTNPPRPAANATEQIDWSRCVASPTISPTLDTYATRRA
mmetsp:Transcript_4889/g.21827  ORF Transcript_4889/g.21827 Transcript_4889/m.21827 type:complete len:325 (+) Transcript_4889:36-1010(+)